MRRPDPSAIELVTIDLDGTLIDSAADLHAAVEAMQAALGGPSRSLESVRDWVGNGVERLVHRAITGSFDGESPPATLAEGLRRFREAYAECNGTRSTLYPGVVRTLETLGGRGRHLVCVTNKEARFTEPLLGALGLERHFALTLSGDSLPEKKPHPAPLLHAAEALGIPPARALHVGDSVSDIRAARAAGFVAVGVSYGYNHGMPLGELGGSDAPHRVIDSFAELADIVEAPPAADGVGRRGDDGGR